jgi:hypothetical protein
MINSTSPQIAKKVPVCIRADYIMYLELFEGFLWFHVDVKNWSSKVKKNGKEDFNCLQKLVGKPIVALVREDDVKLARFAKAFGWFEKCQITLLDGSKATIYANKAQEE